MVKLSLSTHCTDISDLDMVADPFTKYLVFNRWARLTHRRRALRTARAAMTMRRVRILYNSENRSIGPLRNRPRRHAERMRCGSNCKIRSPRASCGCDNVLFGPRPYSHIRSVEDATLREV